MHYYLVSFEIPSSETRLPPEGGVIHAGQEPTDKQCLMWGCKTVLCQVRLIIGLRNHKNFAVIGHLILKTLLKYYKQV